MKKYGRDGGHSLEMKIFFLENNMRFVCFLMMLLTSDAFKLAIAGAHGGLGRELVRQGLDKGWNVNAFVRKERLTDPIYTPVRLGWLNEAFSSNDEIRDVRLQVLTYSKDEVCCDAVVICLSGIPFQPDDTTAIVDNLVRNLSADCRALCLVSAHGVGDSIIGADIGIQVMRGWYLQPTYGAKQRQEEMVTSLANENFNVLILRPRVLSYARIPLNPISTTRQDLAKSILDWIVDNSPELN